MHLIFWCNKHKTTIKDVIHIRSLENCSIAPYDLLREQYNGSSQLTNIPLILGDEKANDGL